MCRTGVSRFGIGNWIFLFWCLHLFTYAQTQVPGGEDDEEDFGVRFTTEPSDLVLAEGERALLPCAAEAGPAPGAGAGASAPRRPVRLSWRHAPLGAPPPTRDHGLTAQDKLRRQASNGSLAIEGMASALAGQYQCVAAVEGVGTIVSRVALLHLAELPELAGAARVVAGAEGGAALLACGVTARRAWRVAGAAPPDRRVYGAAKLHAAPPTLDLNVTWLKNGSPLRLGGERLSLSPSGALELDPLRAHDAAAYRCQVALLARPARYRTGAEIELRVSPEAGAESPPRFIVTPQPVTVVEGASVTFDCAATGNPKPEMIWLNNGVAIDLSDLDSRFYLVGSGSLRVQSARALDAGAYTCRAHSRLDSADHTTQLHVLTAPRVHVGGPTAVAHVRGDVTLRCDVRGKPTPAVAWLKDGDPLTPNNHDIALVDGWSLRILGVLALDGGMFQCAARSAAGGAAPATRLLVRRAPALQPNATAPPPTHAIFDSLVPSPPGEAGPDPPDGDFLGETSSAYTYEPDQYEDYVDETDDPPPAGNSSAVSPPRGLRAPLVKHRFVTLSWEPPLMGADDVTGYTVLYRVRGSERERAARGGAGRREMNVGGLQPNTSYVLAVLALSAAGQSPPSEPIEVTTPEEELTHGPPTDVRAEALGPHTLRVTWTPPPGDPPRYTVHYSEEGGREQVRWAAGGEVTLGGLRAGASYAVVVAAVGGAPAPALQARTPADAPAAPPSDVSAAPSGAGALLVRWAPPPPRALRGPLTGYKLRYRPAAPPAPPARRRADSVTTPADTLRAELRGLAPNTAYQVRVCAINANGSGPFSEWVTATTQQLQLDESQVPPQPPPLTTRAGRDWISVWWGAEAGGRGVAVRGYRLGWGLGVPDSHAGDLPAHTHSHLIRGLESNAEYVISLRARNALGLGPAVYATVRTRAAPDGDPLGDEDDEPDEPDEDDEDDEDHTPPLIPPVGLKVIMLSSSTAVVYWTDPTLPKGQPATDGRRYVVRWAGGGGRPRTFNATDLNCMLDDLKPFTRYEFAVKLIKGGRESAWSLLASNTSLEAAPGGPPRELRASPAPPPWRALELAWAPPARPNGVLTGYVVMYASQRSSAGSEEWQSLVVGGERTRARVDRLRPRTTYLLKVQARNAKGLGPPAAPIAYTTAMESGEGGGLASATSAWLWASAGGALAVLALAAALALSLCCRREHPPLSPDTSTYQKSSASAAIKPPDLWIHHDQMELKHLDKSIHSSAMSASSAEGPLGASTLTLPLPRAAEYEPARHAPPSSLDRRHMVPTYVAMTGLGVGVGCASTCERRPHPRMHPDQSTPLLAGVGSPQTSMGSLAPLHAPLHAPPHAPLPHHPPPALCGAGACPLGAACTAPGGSAGGAGGGVGGAGGCGGGDIYACAARERGHYVAYEPLGHYTHRDSLSSDAGAGGPAGAGAGGSLGRRARAGLHSFADAASDHSTPSHDHDTSRGSGRETSPYKKSASSSPGHIPNRLQLGGPVPRSGAELEPLTPSRSTERLQREMLNLEGLMKDLSAITHHQFHC